uniref:Uncharacterized protein n=1 Tax=Anguilla anguilla TaxID=7936 RepID=A0A0E9SMD5_ANGAN
MRFILLPVFKVENIIMQALVLSHRTYIQVAVLMYILYGNISVQSMSLCYTPVGYCKHLRELCIL